MCRRAITRVELRRRDRTGRHLELADQAELRHLLHARADPAAGVAGAAKRQQHMVADAGADRREAHWIEATALAPPIGVVAEKRRSGMPKLVMKSSATAPPWP